MNRFFISVILMLCIVAGSCKKKEKKQYSTWYVNEEQFRTNEVDKDIGKARTNLYAAGFTNSFSITFDLGYELPFYGSYPLAKVQTNDPSFAHIGFYYYSIHYIPAPSSNSYLVASSVNGKAHYSLSSTWFINYDDPSDSVLIRGEFNEP